MSIDWRDGSAGGTPLDAANLNAAFAALGLDAVDVTSAIPYNASPGQLVLMDLTLGNGLVLLPQQPVDGSPAAAGILVGGTDPVTFGPATLTVECQGPDSFADGSTQVVLSLGQGQMLGWLYDAETQTYNVNDQILPVSGLDQRYLPVTNPTAGGTLSTDVLAINPVMGVTIQAHKLGTLAVPGPPGFSGVTVGDTFDDWGGNGTYRWTGVGWIGPSSTSPPNVITSPADTPTSSGFEMYGSINANDVATTYQFGVGTDGIAFATKFPGSPASAGSGVAPVSYSQAATGLSPATVYYFRLEATAGGVTYYGSTIAFTTLATSPVPTPTTGAPVTFSQTTATLPGNVNANGAVGVTWQFEYGPTTAYGTQSPATPGTVSGTTSVAVSTAITGLLASTPYHFRLNAILAGTTYNGADQTFTTLATGATPTLVSQSSTFSVTAATFSCVVNPNGTDAQIVFEYGLTTAYGTSLAAKDAGSGTTNVTTSTTVSGVLTANTTYHWCTVVSGVAGPDQTFTTLPASGAPKNTTPPSITGSATVGSQLTCNPGVWTGSPTPVETFQWTQNTTTAISGETEATYTVLEGDAGQQIGCTVTSTNSAGAPFASVSVTIAEAVSGTLSFVGDFSNILVTPGSPVLNPHLTQYGFQEGAYWTNLNSSPYANMVLYAMSDLPGLGLPAHPILTTPALRLITQTGDNTAPVTPPYGGVHAPPNTSTGMNTESDLFGGGGTSYIGFSLLVDPSYPVMTGNVFQQFMEVFGTPFGNPPLAMGIEPQGQGVPVATAQSFYMQVMTTAAAGHFPWTAPMIQGEWVDFVICLNSSTSGTVQLWMNGVQQTFNKGNPSGMTGWNTKTIGYNTLNGNSSGANNGTDLYFDNYRMPFTTETVLWQAGAKVGSTYSIVSPGAGSAPPVPVPPAPVIS